jgi:hypothetical protein
MDHPIVRRSKKPKPVQRYCCISKIQGCGLCGNICTDMSQLLCQKCHSHMTIITRTQKHKTRMNIELTVYILLRKLYDET